MNYRIELGGQIIGQATVRRKGLYYYFDCSCNLSGESKFCILVTGDAGREDLGLLVPEQGKFVLHTSRPAKRLGEEIRWFEAVPKRMQLDETFIPISPEEPFRYLQRLEQAYLQVRDGQVGIMFNQ